MKRFLVTLMLAYFFFAIIGMESFSGGNSSLILLSVMTDFDFYVVYRSVVEVWVCHEK